MLGTTSNLHNPQGTVFNARTESVPIYHATCATNMLDCVITPSFLGSLLVQSTTDLPGLDLIIYRSQYLNLEYHLDYHIGFTHSLFQHQWGGGVASG